MGTVEECDYLDAHIGQDGLEGHGGLAGAVSDEESELGEAIVEVRHEVADLLGVHRLSGLVVVPSRCTDRLGTSRTKNT